MSAAVAKLKVSPAPPTVVQAARSLVPRLREARAETDRLARIPDDIVEAMRDLGLYSMTVPRAYGGLQTNVSTWMEAVTEIGRGDAGAAWALTLVTACNWMAGGLYPRAVADQVFARPGARCAGVFSGRAVQVRPAQGGVFVEQGTWFFNSGVYQADWDMLGVPMFDAAGAPIGPGIAMVPMRDVKILHDWDTSGLRGSGSSNVSMANVFIPNERIVPLMPSVEGRQPRTFPGAALYNSAFTPLMVIILAFPVLGAGMHMLESFLERLPSRDIKLTPYTKQGEAPVTHLQVGQASSKIDAARLIIANGCREIDDWAQRDDYMPRDLRARICRDAAVANQLVWEAVDLLGTAAGGSFSHHGNILNRIWQDVKVATMHPYISLATHFELYGRILCGIEPSLMPV